MKLYNPVPVREIARLTGARVVGNMEAMATGINEIHKVCPGDITFVDREKYYKKSLSSAATIILIDKEAECPPGKTLLITGKPFEAYDHLVRMYCPYLPLESSIDPGARIHPSATIEPQVIIGRHVVIGADTHIEAHSVIRDYTEIGERVVIQSGAIIGSDAFYFKKEAGKYQKWTSCGRVIIHDDVYIGANCTINRGVSGDTIIGRGTKIDCLVQIGHGAVIGEDCLIAAQVGVAGKTIIGNRCTLYGQVGIAQNLHLGDDVTVLAKSGVGEDIANGMTYFGIPAGEARKQMKELALVRRLPEIWSAMKPEKH